MSSDLQELETSSPDESPSTEVAPTQADLYEDLKRIGELEDQKQSIQEEIDQRTERLTSAIPKLDKSSLLYQMLSKTLQAAPAKRPGQETARETENREEITRLISG